MRGKHFDGTGREGAARSKPIGVQEVRWLQGREPVFHKQHLFHLYVVI